MSNTFDNYIIKLLTGLPASLSESIAGFAFSPPRETSMYWTASPFKPAAG